jgi:hypothetical protein
LRNGVGCIGKRKDGFRQKMWVMSDSGGELKTGGGQSAETRSAG